MVVGIFLALLSYLGTVVYHNHNHGFRGISVDNPLDGYSDNLVQRDDGRISELLYVATSQEEHSSSVIPEWIGMMATERSSGFLTNEESNVEVNNYLSSFSHFNEIENENVNENETADGIEMTESNENRSEQEERERSEEKEVEVEVEVEEEIERSQHGINHPYIQSSSSSSSSSFSTSLPSPQVKSEDAEEDMDVKLNMDDENDIDTSKDVSTVTETETETGTNHLSNHHNNNDYQTPIRNIQINEIFNVPFPENISDSYENGNNGFPSEEKIKKYISSLLKSFEHIHSSDYM